MRGGVGQVRAGRRLTATLVAGLLVTAAFVVAGRPAGAVARVHQAASGSSAEPGVMEPVVQGPHVALADLSPAAQAKLQRGYLVPDPAGYEARKQAAEAAAPGATAAPNAATTPNAVTVSPSWQGVDDPNVAPSDSTGAIGPSRYVELVNEQFGIYDRTGAAVSTGTLASLTGDSTGSLTDPQIIWDPATSRFYYVIVSLSSTNIVDFGFSKTDTPSSAADWCTYSKDYGFGSNLPDFPKLGDLSTHLLVGVDVFSAAGAFLGADLLGITKPASGTTCPASSSFQFAHDTGLQWYDGSLAQTVVPANAIDSTSTGYVLSASLATGDSLTAWRVTASGATLTLSPGLKGEKVTLPSFSVPPNAVQEGSTKRLDTLDGRLTQAVEAVDPLRGVTAVWTQHTVAGGAGSEVRWYEVSMSSGDPPPVEQSGTVSSNSLYVFNAAISPDRRVGSGGSAFGDSMVLGFNSSSASSFVSIDTVNKIGSGAQSAFAPIQQSTQAYTGFACGSFCRWGDYSGATPDPAASLAASHGTVWLSNQWNDSRWRTWNEAMSPQAASTPDGELTPLTPARILDTRNGTGGRTGKLGPGESIDVAVTGVGGVPSEPGVAAVVMNVTVTEPTAASFLTVWPSGQSRPLISNLNFVAGQTVPNLVTVKVGSNGKVSVYNSSGATHVIFDIVGWYASSDGQPGSRFHATGPTRILDTRDGTGQGFAAPLGQNSVLALHVVGVGGVPPAGVTGVVMNVTVTQPTASSFLTVYPEDVGRPNASNLNFVPGLTVANLVTVRVPADGNVDIYNLAGSVHVIADVVGWYDGDRTTEAGRFVAVDPFRALDTRVNPGSPVGPNTSFPLHMVPGPGLPSSGVGAVVVNTTAVQPTATGYMTVFPDPPPPPLASNLNFTPGAVVPNLVVVRVPADGTVDFYNEVGFTHLVVDVFGYFTG